MSRECKYMAIGRYTKGVSVLGYMLQDINSGAVRMIERQMVEKIALNKQINNITAQLFDGKIVMKGINCKISALPNYDSSGRLVTKSDENNQRLNEVNIIGRLLDGKSTVGYILGITTNGVKCGEKCVSREKTLEIAKMGKISNARVQMSNDEAVLRGVGCKLAKLPSVKYSK